MRTVYYERGKPVRMLTWWRGQSPRNVLIERKNGERVVRPFRGLRVRPSPAASSETT